MSEVHCSSSTLHRTPPSPAVLGSALHLRRPEQRLRISVEFPDLLHCYRTALVYTLHTNSCWRGLSSAATAFSLAGIAPNPHAASEKKTPPQKPNTTTGDLITTPPFPRESRCCTGGHFNFLLISVTGIHAADGFPKLRRSLGRVCTQQIGSSLRSSDSNSRSVQPPSARCRRVPVPHRAVPAARAPWGLFLIWGLSGTPDLWGLGALLSAPPLTRLLSSLGNCDLTDPIQAGLQPLHEISPLPHPQEPQPTFEALFPLYLHFPPSSAPGGSLKTPNAPLGGRQQETTRAAHSDLYLLAAGARHLPSPSPISRPKGGSNSDVLQLLAEPSILFPCLSPHFKDILLFFL